MLHPVFSVVNVLCRSNGVRNSGVDVPRTFSAPDGACRRRGHEARST